ncbi:P-loop NTPase fold protein [Pseudoalteromonas pernae]|uniref:P-loop NTPase fold protein n=1 Tax=Pseudoalteromonas pernae TaxID=3118054 RepID=UPI00324234F1
MLARYSTIFIYAVLAIFFYTFLSNTATFQDIWSWWQTILISVFIDNGKFNFYLYYMTTFTIGLLIHQGLLAVLVCPKSTLLAPNFKYPPISFSVLIAMAYYYLTAEQFNDLKYLISLLIGLSVFPTLSLFKTIYNRLVTTKGEVSEVDRPTLSPLQISSSDNILRTINDEKGLKNIALCGKYGVGKSTTINHVLENLDNKYVHCDVELWGVKNPSIIHYVLDKVIKSLSRYINMSAFLRLPEHYLSAFSETGKASKFFSILLSAATDPEAELHRLDNTLNLCGLKLVITIQDLDRNSDAEASLEELAGLLDRMKNLKNIIYIFAAENKPIFADTISRVCSLQEDLPPPDLSREIRELENTINIALPESYFKAFIIDGAEGLELGPTLVNELIPDYRSWQKLKSEAESLLVSNLKGEIYTYDYLVLRALKSNEPAIFEIIERVLLGQISKDINTVEKLLKHHLPAHTLNHKNVLIKTLEYFSFAGPNVIWHRLSDQEFKKTTSEQRDKDTYFIHESDRKDLLFPRNARYIDIFATSSPKEKLLPIYELLTNAFFSNPSDIRKLIEKLQEAEKTLWLEALSTIGNTLLYHQSAKEESIRSLLTQAIQIKSSQVSYKALDALKITSSTIVIHGATAANSPALTYLISDKLVDDIKNNIEFFTCETSSALGKILQDIELLKRQFTSGFENVSTKLVADKIFELFLGKSPHCYAILISILDSDNRKDPWLDQIIDNIDRIEKLLSAKVNSDFVLAYIQMYPEYSFTHNYVKGKLEEAKHRVLNKLAALKKAYKQNDTATE